MKAGENRIRLLRTVLKAAAGTLCAAGCIWFLLPLLRGGFGLGTAFGLGICLLGLAAVCLYRRCTAYGGWRKLCARILAVCYGLGLCWVAFLTVLMCAAPLQVPPPGTDVIVLGAQVYSAERMGVNLTRRVDRASAYLEENPEARCIVTGGQSSSEPCPEALTQQNALLHRGIEAERIYVEDRSRNTRENLAFAMEIVQEEGLGTEFAIVTQGFHMYRALQLAEHAGITAYTLVAETDPLLFPACYGRELLSLTKWCFERLVLEG